MFTFLKMNCHVKKKNNYIILRDVKHRNKRFCSDRSFPIKLCLILHCSLSLQLQLVALMRLNGLALVASEDIYQQCTFDQISSQLTDD